MQRKEIKRGDLFYYDFGTREGSIQSGVRPVLVVQADDYNRNAPTIIVACLTAVIKKRYLPSHIILGEDFGLKKPSMVLLEQIQTVNKEHLTDYIGSVDDEHLWRQINAPQFSGSTAEAAQVAATFPDAAEGTTLRTVGDGVVEASHDGHNTMWYNSAYYDEPDAPHTVMTAANGVDWYAMNQHADSPQFETGDEAYAYNQAYFQQFMPGFDLPISSVDGSQRLDGHFEVRHEDGSGTMFYDTTQFAPPRGDYQVFEDVNGSQWY